MVLSIYCPYCHKHTALRMAHYRQRNSYGIPESYPARTNELDYEWWIGICNACEMPVLVEEEGLTIFPHPLPEPSEKAIPEDLRADLDEAKMCFSVGCYRACCVLARRCVQRACIQKGAKKHDLIDQIKELTDSGAITKDVAEWATVVRWIGNDSAHPNANAVEKDDAEDSLKLSEQFLYVLFVAPALAQARRSQRGK